jgi:hypothetical protein
MAVEIVAGDAVGDPLIADDCLTSALGKLIDRRPGRRRPELATRERRPERIAAASP